MSDEPKTMQGTVRRNPKPVMTVEQFQALDRYIHAVIDYRVQQLLHPITELDYSEILETGRAARILLTGEPEPQRQLEPGEAEDLSKLFSSTEELP
jgi:hypothetical protein